MLVVKVKKYPLPPPPHPPFSLLQHQPVAFSSPRTGLSTTTAWDTSTCKTAVMYICMSTFIFMLLYLPMYMHMYMYVSQRRFVLILVPSLVFKMLYLYKYMYISGKAAHQVGQAWQCQRTWHGDSKKIGEYCCLRKYSANFEYKIHMYTCTSAWQCGKFFLIFKTLYLLYNAHTLLQNYSQQLLSSQQFMT